MFSTKKSTHKLMLLLSMACLMLVSIGATAVKANDSGVLRHDTIALRGAATDVAWINAAGGNWSDPANWQDGTGVSRVPTASDNAFITFNGTYSVNLDVSPTLNSLTLGGVSGKQTLSNVAQTLTLINASTVNANGLLDMSGGTLAGNGPLTIAGAFNWAAGMVNTTINVANSGTIAISGPVAKVFNGSTITNNGIITWTGAGNIDGLNGATFNNTGLFSAQTNAGFVASASNSFPIFNNLAGGTFSKAAGTGTTTVDRWYFNQSGNIAVASGTTVDFVSLPLTINDGASFSGAGRTRSIGGPFAVPNNAAVSGNGHLELTTGGTLGGNGVLTLNSNLFDWTGGTLGGKVSVVANATMNISGSAAKAFNGGTITNNGTITWTGAGNIDGLNGATFNNNSLFSVQTNAGLVASPSNSFPIFNNLAGGTFSKALGTGTTTVDRWYFNQSGNIAVAAGTTVDFISQVLTLNNGARFTGLGRTRINGSPANVPNAATVGGNGHLELTTGGTLGGNGVLTLNSNLFNWTAGMLQGTVVVAANATMTISGAAAKVFNGGTITNNGTIAWTGAGNIDGLNGATFNNTGLFSAQTNAGFVASASNSFPIFNNLAGGTFSKAAGTGTTTVDRWYFNQSGNIAVTSGTTVDFVSQVLTLNNGATFTGAGRTRVNGSPANVPINATVSGNGHLELTTGGTLNGNGVLTLNSNLFNWTAGTVTGKIMVRPNVIMTISGAAIKTFNGGTITNNGTITWTGAGNIDGLNGATFNNKGLFSAQTNAGFVASPSNSFPTFNNLAGSIFSKVVGTGTTTVDRWFFNQSGTLSLLNGTTLRFTSGYTQTAGKTDLNGGALASGDTINIQGGALIGSGTITGNVVSGGTISPGHSPGVLTIAGNYTQTATGALAIEIGGTTAGTQFDQLHVSGVATLSGTLNVALISGFGPTIGQNFQVLTYGSHNGMFARLTGSGAQFRPVYNATMLILRAIGNDVPGFTITPSSGLVTTEAGGKATFTVKLNRQPKANVTIGLKSSNPSNGTVAPQSLTFTPNNWNTPQTVAITGVMDSVHQVNELYQIITTPAVSADALYNGLNPPEAQVTNIDNTGQPTLTLTPLSATLRAGQQQQFMVTTMGLAKVTVSWRVQEADSGGTITQQGLYSLYTAPEVPGRYHVVVTVVGAGHSPLMATAIVTVVPRARAVRLSSGQADSVKNAVLLNFGEHLDAVTAADAGHYYVLADGEPVTLESAAYDAARHLVLLSLPAGALQAGDKVLVGWSNLSDADGHLVSDGKVSLVAR